MASRIIGNTGPGISQVLGAAIEAQAAKGERSFDMSYAQGTPIRFAGEAFTKGSGIGGPFASFLRAPEGTKYGRDFVSQWTPGPFKPVMDDGAMPSDTGAA